MYSKKMPARRAPSLPMDADRPWQVARTSVGKISPGSIQVVALGPNWPKKDDVKYRNCDRCPPSVTVSRLQAPVSGQLLGQTCFQDSIPSDRRESAPLELHKESGLPS